MLCIADLANWAQWGEVSCYVVPFCFCKNGQRVVGSGLSWPFFLLPLRAGASHTPSYGVLKGGHSDTWCPVDFKTGLRSLSSQGGFSLLRRQLPRSRDISWACKRAVGVNRAGVDGRAGTQRQPRDAPRWHRQTARTPRQPIRASLSCQQRRTPPPPPAWQAALPHGRR